MGEDTTVTTICLWRESLGEVIYLRKWPSQSLSSWMFVSQAYFFLPYYAGPYTEECVVPAGGALAKPLPLRSLILGPDPGETAANRINKHCSVYMDIFILRGKDK